VTTTRTGATRGGIQYRSADHDVLQRLASTLGSGRVNGPYGSSPGSFGGGLTWLFQVNRQADLVRVARRLKPHMGRRRAQQIAEMLTSMGEVP
jgi:hypothetical protein